MATQLAATTGTQTAVISTEHTLAQASGANLFQFSVDCTNMVNGDITELRVYRIVNSTAIQTACGIFANIQASPLKEYKFTGSAGVTNGYKVTLKQTAGTGRNYDWEVLADSGNYNSNLVNVAGSAVSTSTAQIGTNVVSIAGAASNVKKNQALSKFEFAMTDSTSHAPATGKTVATTRSIDGGAFASTTNSVTEVANGIYYVDLSTSDLNGNVITLRATATGCDDTLVTIVTQP